jgi:hypothetical protein
LARYLQPKEFLMRRYGLLIVVAFAVALAVLRSGPSAPAAAAPLLGVVTLTPTSTSTETATATATATSTGTSTQTATTTPTPTQTSTPTSTPTVGILLPIILKIPTPTPTATFTPSPTFTPSKTPTTFTCNGRFDGSISKIPKADGSTTYATYIEFVHILEWVHNNNGATTCFGILGYNAIKPDGSNYPFNSQWSAGGVPSKLLTIYANCWGPYGQPCAGSQASGQQVDTSLGSARYVISEVGQYTVYYMVCYSNFNACLDPNQHPNWAQLGVIQFTAVNWTPPPPSGPQGSPTPEATVTENPGPVCYLITNDPRGTYLKCDTNQLKERHLFRS